MIYHPSDLGYVKLWAIPVPYRLLSKSNDKSFNRKTGQHFKSARFKAFEQSLAWLAVSVCGRPKLKEGWVVMEPHYAKRDAPDPSNLPKSVLDALVQGGIFEDDDKVGVTVPPHPVYGDFNSVVEIWGLKG